jgi:miniconductance mechanosensitive channel
MRDLNFQSIIQDLFIKKGLGDFASFTISFLIVFIFFSITSLIIFWISKKTIIGLFKKLSQQTSTIFDDLLLKNRLPEILSFITPLFFLYHFFLKLFSLNLTIEKLILNILEATTVIIFIWLIRAFLKTLNDYLKTLSSFKDKPIDSYIQVFMIFLWFMGAILILSILTGKEIGAFLTALGALSAVILFIFKDSILGFVASVQITINDTVRIGDWITMRNSDADGDVISISLSSVQVQNFDKTITTIPTYKLVSDSFINWRGMSTSDGRRIKRSILIKVSSIRFLNAVELIELEKIQLISNFIENKKNEIEVFNEKNEINKSVLINGRNFTNLGLFRRYTEAYLENNKMLNQKMTIMCRQLAPTSQGVPIEIYAFSKEKEWKAYEHIMADLFDHLIASISFFHLDIFEFSSGNIKI